MLVLTMTGDLPPKAQAWVMALFDEMVRAGYISPPWQPDTPTTLRMQGYFEAGLDPAEAAEAMYGTHH